MRDQSVTRREFARKLTTGTTLVIGSWAAAGRPPAIAGDDIPAPQETRPDTPPPEPEDLLLASIIQQYPSEHPTEQMLIGIRADLSRHRRQAEQVREVALENSDEPATILRAWRRE